MPNSVRSLTNSQSGKLVQYDTRRKKFADRNIFTQLFHRAVSLLRPGHFEKTLYKSVVDAITKKMNHHIKAKCSMKYRVVTNTHPNTWSKHDLINAQLLNKLLGDKPTPKQPDLIDFEKKIKILSKQIFKEQLALKTLRNQREAITKANDKVNKTFNDLTETIAFIETCLETKSKETLDAKIYKSLPPEMKELVGYDPDDGLVLTQDDTQLADNELEHFQSLRSIYQKEREAIEVKRHNADATETIGKLSTQILDKLAQLKSLENRRDLLRKQTFDLGLISLVVSKSQPNPKKPTSVNGK